MFTLLSFSKLARVHYHNLFSLCCTEQAAWGFIFFFANHSVVYFVSSILIHVIFQRWLWRFYFFHPERSVFHFCSALCQVSHDASSVGGSPFVKCSGVVALPCVPGWFGDHFVLSFLLLQLYPEPRPTWSPQTWPPLRSNSRGHLGIAIPWNLTSSCTSQNLPRAQTTRKSLT